MYDYYYNPDVNYLLLGQASEYVNVAYVNASTQFALPVIGPRPPCYIHPQYVPYYPVI